MEHKVYSIGSQGDMSDLLTVLFVLFCIAVIAADHFKLIEKGAEYCAKGSNSILNNYEKTNLN